MLFSAAEIKKKLIFLSVQKIETAVEANSQNHGFLFGNLGVQQALQAGLMLVRQGEARKRYRKKWTTNHCTEADGLDGTELGKILADSLWGRGRRRRIKIRKWRTYIQKKKKFKSIPSKWQKWADCQQRSSALLFQDLQALALWF